MMRRSRDGIFSRAIDVDHLQEMYKFLHESRWVQICSRMLTMSLLSGGMGIFEGKKSVENVPSSVKQWLQGHCMTFVSEAMEHLTGFGFCIYTIDATSMQMTVVDPRYVVMTVYSDELTRKRYCVHSAANPDAADEWGHDERYHIYVMNDIDMESGLTMGLLVKCHGIYLGKEILIRNMETQTSMAATTAGWIESNAKEVVDIYAKLSGIEGAEDDDTNILGYATSQSARLAARRAAIEDIFMHDQQVIRNMGQDGTHLVPGIASRLRMGKRADPTAENMRAVEVGKQVRQRTVAPFNRDLVAQLEYFDREMCLVYGVPYDMAHQQSKQHASSSDVEEFWLNTNSKFYVSHMKEILNDASRVLFHKIQEVKAGRNMLARVAQQIIDTRDEEPLDEDESKEWVAGQWKEVRESVWAEPLRVGIVTVVPQRLMAQWYENFMIHHESFVDYLVNYYECSPDIFCEKDARIRQVELEAGLAVEIAMAKGSTTGGGGTTSAGVSRADHTARGLGGPGRGGAMTISKAASDQQVQTKNRASHAKRTRL